MGCLLAALAIASTCNGATIQKREAIQGTLDRQLDLYGVRVGLKYKDPSDRTKGGQLHVKVDDMRAIFPAAKSKAIEVNAEFDGGKSNTDGIFSFDLRYVLNHHAGGVEKGSLSITREQRGNNWVTKVNSKAEPFSGRTIIPKRIRNMSWYLTSDRQTKFSLSYTNPDMNRDFHVNIDRIPGKQMHVVITNGDRKHDLTFKVKDFDLRRVDGNFQIQVEGTSLGEAVSGSIKGEANAKGNRIKMELVRGNKKVVQIDSKIKKNIPALYFETKTKYSLLGGALTGTIKMKFENGQLNLENDLNGDKIELRVKVIPGDSVDIEAKKNGVTMWTYKTKRTTVSTPEKFEMDLVTDMTLNPDSMLSHFLDKVYPYGTFQTRKNTVHIFVDKQNGNLFFNKFFVQVNLFKDGEKTVDLQLDTRSKPYKFLFVAPRVFKRWNIKHDKIEATMTHDIGSSIVFDTNVAGGIHIEANRAPNAQGGRDIHILTKKAGKQMMKFDLHTEKEIDSDKIVIRIKDSMVVDPDSALFRRVISKYRLLTQFQQRTGDYEIFINKKETNLVLNKFYIKGEVKKDGQTAMKLLLTTAEKPYKLELYLPAILNKIYSDMDEYKVTMDHVPGQKLNIQTNGRELANGDYTLTDNEFKTKITLANGDWLEPKVTWEGFFPQNNFKVSATGSKRNFDIDLSRKATKPDWDFSTPESLRVDLNAKGESPRWGNWMLSRDASFKVENKVIQVDVSGKAHFKGGLLATSTPIVTEVHMKYLIPQRDLQGKFSKMINGKEYSINFPDGFGVMPQIKMGQ